MAKIKPTRYARQAAWIALAIVAALAVLALMDSGLPRHDRCSYQFPKLVVCLLAKHETLVGSLIGVAGALTAAVIAWRAIIAQIASDREIARNADRAYVTGGPGARLVDEEQNEIGIVSTAMNTGKTPAFTKMVYWGICKESDWARAGENWPRVSEAQSELWEEVLPPQMDPEDRYPIKCTAMLVPDGENHVCYGTIIYRTVFGDEFPTHWKHRVVREGKTLRSDALPGGYSSEWVFSGQNR
jgi:hypothetical protein